MPAHIDVLEQGLEGGQFATLLAIDAHGQRVSAVMGDERHGFVLNACVAVGATDALAVGGKDGPGPVAGCNVDPPLRYPDRQHPLQRIRIDMLQDPTDGRRRRRDVLLGLEVETRADGLKIVLGHRLSEILDRNRAMPAAQAAQHIQRQDRGQRVAKPASVARVRNLAKQLMERAKLGAGTVRQIRGRTPLRMLLGAAKPRLRVRVQGIDEHFLGYVARPRVPASTAGIAERAPHPDPVGCVVNPAVETLRVDKGFRQLKRMAVNLAPVGAEGAQIETQNTRPKITQPSPPGKQQIARVVHHQVQTLHLRRRLPANPAIARPTLPRPNLPPNQRKPLAIMHEHITQTATRKALEAKVMMLVHQRVPAHTLVRTHKTQHAFAHRTLSRPIGHQTPRHHRRKLRYPFKPATILNESQ